MKPFTRISMFLILLLWGCAKTEPDPLQGGLQKSNLKEILPNPKVVGISDVVVNYDPVNYAFEITVPTNTSLKAIRLDLNISPKAKIDPDPSSPHDYTDPVNYTVTAEDGSKQKFTFLIIGKLLVGKNCLVSRIENVNSKEYFSFQYDSKGRVVQLDSYFSTPAITKPFPAKVTFQYNEAGDMMEAHLTGSADGINQEGVRYKPVYEKGRLVRVAYKNQNGAEAAIKTSVDDQKQIIQMEFPSTVCYSYNYFGGAITKITPCGSVFINTAMDYSILARNFTTGQSANPAFMCIYIDFLKEFDGTGLLFQLGLLMPSERTEHRRPDGRIYERSTVKYKVNSDSYPIDMLILQQKKLDSDFPYNNSIHYLITYTNCQ